MSGRIVELKQKKAFDRMNEEEAKDNSPNILNQEEEQLTNPIGRQGRVTFSEEEVGIDDKMVFDNRTAVVVDEDKPREGWDNKIQFLLGVVSYAVGLGNVWRFPYLCQQNGGGAFLIPYCIMMLLEGVPLFLIEMGIGQRLRTGPIGVWNAIHPYLGGVGISSAVVSFLVALYYNVIITWCLYYLSNSFHFDLPWATCPMTGPNSTIDFECGKSSSPASYFWYRNAIETTESLGDLGGLNSHMTVCLVVAWSIVYLCVMKGIKTSGKVMYLTATFPYIVTTIFLVRSAMLEGASAGIAHMFTPQLNRLFEPKVWLDAATQIFYSMGLGFGGLIAFSSYNPIKNDVKRDVIVLSIANIVTSLYTAFVIFCVLGFMGHNNYVKCIQKDMDLILTVYPDRFSDRSSLHQAITVEQFAAWSRSDFAFTDFSLLRNLTCHCDLTEIISQAAEGTGLAFIVFTEAMVQFPLPPLWALMFFLMLLMLGLGSMFGTLEGVITSLHDLKLFPWLKKPVLTAILCSISCLIGLIFATRAGEYWVKLFDEFAGSYALMGVAFFEVMGVVYVYGYRRFSRDIEFMTGDIPNLYWQITWRFISPMIMFFLFFASLFKSFRETPTYFSYNSQLARVESKPYPVWALYIAGGMVFSAIAPVPFVWFVRKFKIIRFDNDLSPATKQLGSTPSTTYLLKSQPSFNRMIESTGSELQTIGLSSTLVGKTDLP